jgi:hypothetical protein
MAPPAGGECGSPPRAEALTRLFLAL